MFALEKNLIGITSVLIIIEIVTADDTCFVAGFSEDVQSCDGFDNQFMKCDGLSLEHGDDDDALALAGVIDLLDPIDEDHDVLVEVYKKLDLADELLFTTTGGICSSLKNTDTPWYTIMHALNATVCPIPAKTYEVTDMQLDLSFADDFMNHEFCGEYEAVICINKETKQLSCYVIQIKVSEVECKKEK